MTSQPKLIGDLIRLTREDGELGSIERAAKTLGVNKNTLASYELGKFLPDIDFLVVFAEKTGTDFNELLRLRLASSKNEAVREFQERFASDSPPTDKFIPPVQVPESLLEMAGGAAAQRSLDVLMELLLVAGNALAAIKADTTMPAQQSVPLLASLLDTIERAMSSMRGMAPEIDKVAVAMKVMRGMAAFVEARFPQYLKVFMEILEPFGDELAPILSEKETDATDTGGTAVKR